jgi:riboflavin kinase/FMN adenylyltransferase
MQVLTQASEFLKIPGPVVLAAGFFDGVHKGHQLVLASAAERAREIAGQAWVLTFDRHPLAVLAPSKCPPQLGTLDERLSLMERAGVDGAVVLGFTRQLAVLEPEAFMQRLCGVSSPIPAAGSPRASGLCEIRCGHNWRFGSRAAGTPELLAQLGQVYGFRVVVVPYAEYQGMAISSTRIRCAVREGRLDAAAVMLGRPYSVRGAVVRGRGVGQSLGAATANVETDTEVLPPDGVYAVCVRAGQTRYNGVSNLGVRPTFADAAPGRAVLETHLLDFSGDLYGQTIEVAFLARLRDERAFASPEALTRQIAEDIRRAREKFPVPSF